MTPVLMTGHAAAAPLLQVVAGPPNIGRAGRQQLARLDRAALR
jgi:hypothetical protein